MCVCVHHGWRVTGERQAAGRFRVSVVALVEQVVDVVGQAGGGAHGVVPQDVDHVVQAVQPILHLSLQTSKPELSSRGARWTGNAGPLASRYLRGPQLTWL